MSAETQPHPYDESLERFRAALDDVHKLAHDPFKAPELTVAAGYGLVPFILDMQIEYAILIRGGKRKRGAA